MNKDNSHLVKLKQVVKKLNNSVTLIESIMDLDFYEMAGLDKKQITNAIGKIIPEMFDLVNIMYDYEPNLVPKKLRPNMDAIDLIPYFQSLKAKNPLIYETGLRAIKVHLPKTTYDEIVSKKDSKEQYRLCIEWWDEQPKPFIPLYKIFRNLHHKQNYVRYFSTLLIEKKYRIKLWNDEKQNVDRKKLQKILKKENIII